MRQRPLELLSESLRRHKTDNDVYHDLMAFRVREILLVATVYDAFVLEEEDRLAEQIFGEYHELSLSSAPRITGAASGGEAMEALTRRSFDMVILTTRIDESAPLDLARRIRASHPALPILLLLRGSSEIPFAAGRPEPGLLDGVFVWNGDAKIFLAMIKLVEDRANVATDAAIGLVRVILLVEDSIRYASRYLPLLYSEIMKQTQALIAEERLNEAKKLLRMRARPKVLLARSYEEALAIVGEHKDHLLCLISDVAFARGGALDERAGVRLIEAVRGMLPDLPILVQSSERGHAATARALNADFLDKNADNLTAGLTAFVFERLGFGDFVFRDREGLPIGRARTLDELRALLPRVPDESLVYHAERNHFSAWLMARGEIRIAREIQPIRVSDFRATAEMRQRLIGVFAAVQADKTRGEVLPFDQALLDGRPVVLRLAPGSLGGRGRAIAFVHMLIEDCRLGALVEGMSVCVPPTAVIGTEEFARFVASNGLADLFDGRAQRHSVEERFLAGSLSEGLRDRLRRYLERTARPLSVRATGLFEDSAAQPFAGVYETRLLANNGARRRLPARGARAGGQARLRGGALGPRGGRPLTRSPPRAKRRRSPSCSRRSWAANTGASGTRCSPASRPRTTTIRPPVSGRRTGLRRCGSAWARMSLTAAPRSDSRRALPGPTGSHPTSSSPTDRPSSSPWTWPPGAPRAAAP